MIEKGTFCTVLQMIKEQEEINNKVEEALRLVGDGYYIYGVNNKYYEALMLILKEAMCDHYDYIDWWLHDATEDYRVWTEDMSKEWNLKDPNALYDFIRDECQSENLVQKRNTKKGNASEAKLKSIYQGLPLCKLVRYSPEQFSLDDALEEDDDIEYPEKRNLDGLYIRVMRKGEVEEVCFTDMLEDEQHFVLWTLDTLGLRELCKVLSRAIRHLGTVYNLSNYDRRM